MIEDRGLLLLFCSPSVLANTLVNYSDVLKELASEDDEDIGNTLVKQKTVQELLKMSQDYFDLGSYDNNFQPQRNKVFSFNDNSNIFDDTEDEVSDDPFYTNIKVYHQDYVQPDTLEKRMENMLGRDFFEDKKFVLFVLFTFILLVLTLSCSIVTVRWCYRTFVSKTNPRSSLVSQQQLYQPITIPITYNSPSPATIFTDLDTSGEFPDEMFLQGRKLYPGVL